MGVITLPGQSRLQLRLIVGQDEDGGYQLRTRSFGRIHPNADDADVYEVGAMLMGLQQHEMFSSVRLDSKELVQEGQ